MCAPARGRSHRGQVCPRHVRQRIGRLGRCCVRSCRGAARLWGLAAHRSGVGCLPCHADGSLPWPLAPGQGLPKALHRRSCTQQAGSAGALGPACCTFILEAGWETGPVRSDDVRQHAACAASIRTCGCAAHPPFAVSCHIHNHTQVPGADWAFRAHQQQTLEAGSR